MLAGVVLVGALVWAGWRPWHAWTPESVSLGGLDGLAHQLARSPWVAYRGWVGAWLPWVVGMAASLGLTGRSPGGWVMGLRVVDGDGWEASAFRRVVLGLGLLAWPMSLGLLWPVAWVSRSQRGIPERIAGVYVVRG